MRDTIPDDVCIADFEVLSTLGTGTFGRVRLVKLRNDPTNTPYALKMLKKTAILELQQVDHIRSEKRLLEKINQPYIIRLHKTFQDDKMIYMVLEFVCGGELFSRLRAEGRFSNDVSLFYATEITLCFDYLHGKNIAYRDLKPENILIDHEGHIKITDFGFAKVVQDKTYTLCGTPEYLAPEIIQSKGHNKSVDWWALGILIYEMIAGYPPFYDETPYGIYNKILTGLIEFPRIFHPAAKHLVSKLLTADRARRMGCGPSGSDDVKTHRWFRGVDWEMIQNRAVAAPWVPKIKADDDTTYFSEYPDSKDSAKLPDLEEAEVFKDF